MKRLIQLFKKLLLERNFLSLAGNMGFAFFGFVSFIILTRSLTKEDFGLYTLYAASAAFVDLFRFGLTRTALVRFLSGAEGKERTYWLGANFQIGAVLVVLTSALTGLVVLLFPEVIAASDFRYFFYFFPLYAVSNLFWNNALSVLQAWQAFGRIFILRISNVVSFVLFLLVNVFWLKLGLVAIICGHIGANLLSSIISIVAGWDGTKYAFKYNAKKVKEILNFGKYSMGTMLGSSLLRSADTFLIGLAPFLGAVGVAQYVIPLKLTELLEIPLRSFMATAFPKLSAHSVKGNMEKWKQTFYSYGGAITLMFIPLTLTLFIFAESIVLLLGGNEYRDSLDVLTTVFRVFTIYGLILPLDRISGVALDSINKPQSNLWKVILMATANVIGDLIAIYVFESLFYVALATIFNTMVGLFFGYYYLNREVKMDYKQFWIQGIQFFMDIKNKGIKNVL